MMNRASLCALSALFACPSAIAQGWEVIDPDYRNVRGINYIAAYDGLTQPGNMPQGYNGVAGATVMWQFYDAPSSQIEIDQQLDWAVGLGLNTLRVWLSHPLHYADQGQPTNRMVDNFADFLTKCESRNLYVIPVLWDDHCYGADPCTDPDYVDPTGELPPHTNRQHWIPNPGQTKIDEWAASGFASTEMVDYVTEIVQAGAGSPALLMWDIMNEPVIADGDGNNQKAFCETTLALVKQHDPNTPTTIGFTGVYAGSPAEVLIQNSDLDVISVHAYGTFRDNIQAYIDNALWITDTNGLPLNKPVVITEIGNPGWGQAYKDVLANMAATRYGGTDATPEYGVGWCLFALMNGWEGGNYPYRVQTGIYFMDGEVRDIEACVAIQDEARAQQVPNLTLATAFTQKSPLDASYYPQEPLNDGHDYDDSMRNVSLPEWYYGLMDDTEGGQFAQLFEVLLYDVSTLTLGPNPQVVLDQYDFDLAELCAEVYYSGQLFGMTLTQAERNALLNTWRFVILPYIAELDESSNGNGGSSGQ